MNLVNDITTLKLYNKMYQNPQYMYIKILVAQVLYMHVHVLHVSNHSTLLLHSWQLNVIYSITNCSSVDSDGVQGSGMEYVTEPSWADKQQDPLTATDIITFQYIDTTSFHCWCLYYTNTIIHWVRERDRDRELHVHI